MVSPLGLSVGENPSLSIFQLWVINIYCKKKLLRGLSKALIYEYSKISLGITVLLCPLEE